MPFLASTGNWIHRPSDFKTGFTREDDLECPHCGREMVFNKCTSRADHFSHKVAGSSDSDGVGGCAKAGESREHELMKKKAITQLRENYSSFATIELEKEMGHKRADVVGTFKEPHPKFGNGICVEVQYKNHTKNFTHTTIHYIKRDYAVCWVFYDNWKKLFEVKESLHQETLQPVYLGHIDNIEDEMDLGQPIVPHQPATPQDGDSDGLVQIADGAKETFDALDSLDPDEVAEKLEVDISCNDPVAMAAVDIGMVDESEAENGV
jgi:hypothetical protein